MGQQTYHDPNLRAMSLSRLITRLTTFLGRHDGYVLPCGGSVAEWLERRI